MKTTDPYVRVAAYFPDGEVIYTNPFARYDSTTQESPYRGDLYDINTPLTILFNIGVALCLGMMLTLIYIILRR